MKMMINIEDNDLPITVACKIVRGVKPYNPTPLMKKITEALVGDECACETVDMFSFEEIKEIADYLMVYYNSHEGGD